MQKSKSRGDLQKYFDCRKVMRGYPAKPFDNEEDILHYISGDTITCLLCGKEYVSISHHVIRVHDIDKDEYRQHFNIPYKFPLIGNDLRQRKKEAGLREDNVARILIDAQKSWGKPKNNKPKLVALSKQKLTNSLPNDKPRTRKYGEDYSWHLEQIRCVRNFRNVKPPLLTASWRTFKRRLTENSELRKMVAEAKKYRLERKYL